MLRCRKVERDAQGRRCLIFVSGGYAARAFSRSQAREFLTRPDNPLVDTRSRRQALDFIWRFFDEETGQPADSAEFTEDVDAIFQWLDDGQEVALSSRAA